MIILVSGKLLFAASDTDKLRGLMRKGGDEVLIRITEKALWLILLIIITLYCLTKYGVTKVLKV